MQRLILNIKLHGIKCVDINKYLDLSLLHIFLDSVLNRFFEPHSSHVEVVALVEKYNGNNI